MKSTKSILQQFFFIVLFSVLIINNLFSQTKIYEIKHHKESCIAEATYLCFLVKESSSSNNWDFLYEGIGGFDYEWGYDYTIKVEKFFDKSLEGYQDLPSFYRYKFIEVVSKVKIPNVFNVSLISSYSLDKNENLEKISKGRYRMYSEKIIKCKPLDCKKLDGIIKKELSAILSLKVDYKSDKTLKLVKIICSKDSRKLFYKLCFE